MVQHLGGRWAWLAVALFAVVALSLRWIVQPETSSTTAAPVTTVATTAVPAVSTTTTTVPPTAPAASTIPDEPAITGLWTMPDEIGRTLADAKADIVELSDGQVDDAVAVSDASGEARAQIIHENWKVCSQTPPAGAKFTPESGVAFAVVKTGESCPRNAAAPRGASTDHTNR